MVFLLRSVPSDKLFLIESPILDQVHAHGLETVYAIAWSLIVAHEKPLATALS